VGEKTALVSWALAGGVSGAVTLALVSCIHRLVPPDAEYGAPPNGGPPGALGNADAGARPPSVSVGGSR
jgi:hypothetical protein